MSREASNAVGNVVGIDIGGTKIDIAVADSTGRILARTRLQTHGERGPDQALTRIAAHVAELSDQVLELTGSAVEAHAAACPGVVQADRILMAPNLPGWENLALAQHLESVLGVDRVDVWNDVRAGALAELRFGALRDVQPGIYVSLGTGIAAALTMDGQVLTGAHQAAGEIAYLVPTSGTDDVTAGTERIDTDYAADDAPLEALVGGRALGERASALLGVPVTSQQLFARSDPASRALVEQSLDVLGVAIANLAVFIDPQRIVLGGGMMASARVVLPLIEQRVKQIVPFAPDVVAATFTEDASLHGAIALALDLAHLRDGRAG